MLQTLKDGITHIINDRNVSKLTILFITTAILIAGLWPFNFLPSNKVEWIANENGIRFYGQGIVFNPKPLVTQENAPNNTSLTIEFRVRPLKEYTTMSPSIITLYGDNHFERFIFAQWKTQLIIRIPASSPGNQKRYREVALNSALIRETTHLITVTSGKETTSFYIDGKLRKIVRFSLISADQRLSGRLIIGTSPEGTCSRSWEGCILGLAIYDRILTETEVFDHYHAWQNQGQQLFPVEAKTVALYLFNEHGGEQIRDQSATGNNLVIPATFQPLHRTILGMPAKDEWFSHSNLRDVMVNILGFMPFGFYLHKLLRRTMKLSFLGAYGFTSFAGFLLSLAIELAQVYLPTRDSSLLDVINNVLGTALGALLQICLSTLFRVNKAT
jgi:VanZ family protein